MTEPTYLPTADLPEVLNDLAIELKEINTPAEVMNAVMKAWGGRAIYFPEQKYQVNQRNTEMMAKFNGHNVQDLCREYEITRQRFYQILRVYNRKNIKIRRGKQ